AGGGGGEVARVDRLQGEALRRRRQDRRERGRRFRGRRVGPRLERPRQLDLAQLAQHLDDDLGDLGGGRHLALVVAGQEVDDAVGQLAGKEGGGPAGGLGGGEDDLANAVGVEGHAAAVGGGDPGGGRDVTGHGGGPFPRSARRRAGRPSYRNRRGDATRPCRRPSRHRL